MSDDPFDAAINAQLAGAKVRVSELVRFDFVGEPMLLWNGAANLKLAGETWRGLNGIGAVTPVESSQGGVINSVTFSIAATDEMLAFVPSDNMRVIKRHVRRYMQFFDVREFDGEGNWVNGDPLGIPICFFWGIMGPLSFQRPVARDVRMPQLTQVISVNATNTFQFRSRPPFGTYADRDQKIRSAALNPAARPDQMFINVPTFVEATVRWP